MRNSEKLKARSRSVYKADPSKKKAAAAALYKLHTEKKIESSKAIIVPIRPRRKPIILPIRQRGIQLLIEQMQKNENLQQKLLTLQTLSLNVLPLELLIDPSLN